MPPASRGGAYDMQFIKLTWPKTHSTSLASLKGLKGRVHSKCIISRLAIPNILIPKPLNTTQYRIVGKDCSAIDLFSLLNKGLQISISFASLEFHIEFYVVLFRC